MRSASGTRPRNVTTAWLSWLDGLRRVIDAPVVLVGSIGLAIVLTLPPALLLPVERPATVSAPGTTTFTAQLDNRTGLFVESLAAPVTSTGLTVVIIGDSWADARQGFGLVTIIVIYLTAWTFLSGGIIDRYARNRPTRSVGFFAACGVHAARLVRLTVIAVGLYALVFFVTHEWLLDDVRQLLSGDTTLLVGTWPARVSRYVALGLALLTITLVVDYARVRTIVEDRRSMCGALLAGWRFVRRRPFASGGLYLATTLAILVTLTGGHLLTADTPIGLSLGWPLMMGHVYLAIRLGGTLLFYASEVAYFQSQLAHAGYVAAPTPAWPDSPSAEALRRIVSDRSDLGQEGASLPGVEVGSEGTNVFR